MNTTDLILDRIRLLNLLDENQKELNKLNVECAYKNADKLMDTLVEYKYENMLGEDFKVLYETHFTDGDRIPQMSYEKNFKYLKLVEAALDFYGDHFPSIEKSIKRKEGKPITIPVWGYFKDLPAFLIKKFDQCGIKTLDSSDYMSNGETGRKCSPNYGKPVKATPGRWLNNMMRDSHICLVPQKGDYVILLGEKKQLYCFDGNKIVECPN